MAIVGPVSARMVPRAMIDALPGTPGAPKQLLGDDADEGKTEAVVEVPVEE